MRFIRVFLWILVGAMTLQGILHADEYGSAPTMMGGVAITMSVWRESLWAGAKSLFGTGAVSHVPLPRSLVVAALEETARHPGLETLPQLKQVLATHRRTWKVFRDEEVEWMLAHADIVGSLTSERQDLWAGWRPSAEAAAAAVEAAKADQCWVQRAGRCTQKKMTAAQLEAEAARLAAAAETWAQILAMDGAVSIVDWWNATYGEAGPLMKEVAEFHRRLRVLHDIDTPANPRIAALRMEAAIIASNLGTPELEEDATMELLVESLLLRDLWAACLVHVRAREGRIQELMVAAGVQDMFNAHERVLNASLRVVGVDQKDIVQMWFGEMMGYAWWLGDDVPAIVRRCVAQEAGECRRIGPTEIVSLLDQMSERSRILEDWSRRLFIGMWNALPAVFVLFAVELLVLCMPKGRRDDTDVYEIIEVPARGRITHNVDSRKLARKRLTLRN
jgi:hypothetical protein